MDFLLNAEWDFISNALLMSNTMAPQDLPASLFRFHSAGSPQLLDSSPQFHQKKPAGNERSHKETRDFMISSNGAQEFRRRDTSASISSDFKFMEGKPVTNKEPLPPLSAGFVRSASLSVNPGGSPKVSKKRSRAARRAPTTMLNTDLSNFRAMVQHFTGLPENPFGYSSVNPTFSAHVGQQDWQLLGEPLSYNAVMDHNINFVPHLNSMSDSYSPQQCNSTTFIPFQSLHESINNGGNKFRG